MASEIARNLSAYNIGELDSGEAQIPECIHDCSAITSDASMSYMLRKQGKGDKECMIQWCSLVDPRTLLAEVLERQGVTEGIFFPDFRDADSNVQTSPDMSDEAIVASVVEVSPNDSDEDDMESDNTGDPGPTVAEAAHCVSVMRVFAEKRGLAEKLAHSISEFEAAVVATRPPRRQMKITDFVTRVNKLLHAFCSFIALPEGFFF
ncbi:hypothetical protein HPB51_013149 [Rhipicephalus microplus]|uniref:Uncharacterized protein n=1 Tax=Rhipicephalus microplus TaxID=6941 RepID=A0A9J6E1A8_RHIMP|nr:hypothetical protein HPB51_013149 [Rhipicephalus microplus]